ncbi:MAG: hypothetical protein GC185_02895 [Alphaproteobacteria bacterium]|nr:hypothetical protein [Alphaproteobacteria bacterium]
MKKPRAHLPAVFALALLLAGCIAQPVLNPADMTGKSAAALQNLWGKPDAVEKLADGGEIFTYKTSRAPEDFGGDPMCAADTRSGFMRCTDDILPRKKVEFYCDTHFTLRGGRVKDWQQQGNLCP